MGRCLESVKGVADEIVVLDSFSTDGTESIARQYGAKFVQHPFENYIRQHNLADGEAEYDHVLTLDADEALSPELAKSIERVKQHWEFDGYTMNRMTNYCDKWIKHSGWYPDCKLRLYDKTKGEWVGRLIHERFAMEKGATEGHLNGNLLHYSYNSIAQHVEQANRFTDLTARAAFENGKMSNVAQILIKPILKFIRDYVWKLGFLDGYYGFVICKISAHATFLKYVKLRQLGKARNNSSKSR